MYGFTSHNYGGEWKKFCIRTNESIDKYVGCLRMATAVLEGKALNLVGMLRTYLVGMLRTSNGQNFKEVLGVE